MVVQGCGQRFAEDFGEIHAPVTLQQTFKVLLAVAGYQKLQVRHVDIKNAYLNGVLKEEVFMRQSRDTQWLEKKNLCVN